MGGKSLNDFKKYLKYITRIGQVSEKRCADSTNTRYNNNAWIKIDIEKKINTTGNENRHWR